MRNDVFADRDYPEDPYPGRWPGWSYVHDDGVGRRLHPNPGRCGGWRVGSELAADQWLDVDNWLAERGAAPLAARIPVLSYGSNRCPAKISWLRRELGLPGPAVVLAARTEGLAAVWASGLRTRDGQRPAVLAAVPGSTELHTVWLATPAQIAVLDVCEGRGERYRLARLTTAAGSSANSDGVRVYLEDDGLVDRPWAYLSLGAIRRPLLVDGSPVRCLEVPQARAVALAGVPSASGDGLVAEEVFGDPHPDRWPTAPSPPCAPSGSDHP